MRKTSQSLPRFRRHNKAVNTGIVTALVFLVTYGFSLRQQFQFSELLSKSELLSAFSLRVKYDMIAFEDISQGIESCNPEEPQSCLLLVDYLFKAYNNADLYIDKLEELSSLKYLASLKPEFTNQKSTLNYLMDDKFGLSIQKMKGYGISTPREYINYFRVMDKSIPVDDVSLRNSLTEFKVSILSLLARAELKVSRELSNSNAVREGYYRVQHLFIVTIAVELLVFILMNSVDILINNE